MEIKILRKKQEKMRFGQTQCFIVELSKQPELIFHRQAWEKKNLFGPVVHIQTVLLKQNYFFKVQYADAPSIVVHTRGY